MDAARWRRQPETPVSRIAETAVLSKSVPSAASKTVIFIKFDKFGPFLGLVAQRRYLKGFTLMEKGTLVSGTTGPLASGTKENPGP
jgi:hypothetical protein